MDINEILEKVAEMNGVTVEEVKVEMQKAIHDAAKNPSPEFKARFGDREPDISEFLEMMSSLGHQKNRQQRFRYRYIITR